MQVQVTSHFHSGNPNSTPDVVKNHLVDSAYVINRYTYIEVVINTANELICTGSDPQSICFDFSKDDEWQGWLYTSVKLTADNDAELQLLKGNQYRQHGKGQYVFVILPWEDPNQEKVVASWEG